MLGVILILFVSLGYLQFLVILHIGEITWGIFGWLFSDMTMLFLQGQFLRNSVDTVKRLQAVLELVDESSQDANRQYISSACLF